jgi:serine phosphatase RsbU (regulator of sigma subunit)
VSGKGIGAAVMMAFVRAVMRSALDRSGDPAAALELTNRILVDERRTGMFVTVLCGVLDLDTGVFIFANAGHERPLIARPDGSEPKWLEGGGPLIGVFGRLDVVAQRAEVRPGERLILYTDGISDAQTSDGGRFGEGRLLRTIAESCVADGTAVDTCRAVIQAVLKFQGDADPVDDLAFLVLRRLPGA